MQPSPTPFLTVTQAATEAGVTRKRIRNAITKGKLTGHKPDGQTAAYVIERAEFQRWLDQTPADATA